MAHRQAGTRYAVANAARNWKPSTCSLFILIRDLTLALWLAACAAVATDAVLNVDDPFFAVLGNDFSLLVLVATIAGVLLISAAQVAGRACGVVIAVKQCPSSEHLAQLAA